MNCTHSIISVKPRLASRTQENERISFHIRPASILGNKHHNIADSCILPALPSRTASCDQNREKFH